MIKTISVTVLLFTGISASFSQKMSENAYWISFTDKNQNEYSTGNPSEFLSNRAIQRRSRFDIDIDQSDLPVSSVYIDSLRSLGMKILGSSKWFNACLAESEDYTLLDTLSKYGFVKDFFPAISNFSSLSTNSVKNDALIPEIALKYGESFGQSILLGGPGLHTLGFRGEGMEIAVIDAGFFQVDSFSYFEHLWNNNQILAAKDFVNPGGDIFEESSHGMSVLSTMAVSEPGIYIGTAPGAGYYLLRSEEAPRENKSEEAFWVFAAEFADSAGADIITSSLGYSIFDSISMNYSWDDLDGQSALVTRAAEIAFSKGMIVVSSAGNEGNQDWIKITPPGDGINVLTVGSIDTLKRASLFSSHGNTSDGRIKPDVMAVGYETRLIKSDGHPGYGYGTSYSAPQIAGLTACLWQAMPEKSNSDIINAIRKSSHLYHEPDSIYGYGIPNFAAAYWYLNNLNVEDSSLDMTIFPNPFDESFYIIAPVNINNISICNLDGSLLYSKNGFWGNGEIINVSPENLAHSGIYILVAKNDSNKIVRKIIRK